MLRGKGEMQSGKVSKSLGCWQEIRPTLRGSRSLAFPQNTISDNDWFTPIRVEMQLAENVLNIP